MVPYSCGSHAGRGLLAPGNPIEITWCRPSSRSDSRQEPTQNPPTKTLKLSDYASPILRIVRFNDFKARPYQIWLWLAGDRPTGSCEEARASDSKHYPV